ncbi:MULTISPECIES: fructose 1,6-bisphosphatase [unclassified Microbacterium]|uniref:fructose 1,6-bisphosphatase n=1 Tax=unclassified Microbacterium TaxID=2609290 RepID=UPI0037477FFB
MTYRLSARPRAAVLVLALAAGLSLTGCSQVLDVFGTAPTAASVEDPAIVVVPTPQPTASMSFDSAFSYNGSVSLSTDIADGLQVTLDMWAVAPSRTMEWTPEADKAFGFAINAHDSRVDQKAVLAEKRRVYISAISIRSQTAQASGQTQSPFQFSADPRTLVPADTIRSDRGLLLNSFQGGLYVPETSIHQLPNDTFGITLEFSMNVAVEGSANDETSFTQQTIYQYVPISISPSLG